MRIKKGYFNLINMQFTLFSSFQAPWVRKILLMMFKF